MERTGTVCGKALVAASRSTAALLLVAAMMGATAARVESVLHSTARRSWLAHHPS